MYNSNPTTLPIIYVELLDEGTDTFRPVPAQEIGDGTYVLMGQDFHDPEDEIWAFLPGTRVLVERRTMSTGDSVLVAVKEASIEN